MSHPFDLALSNLEAVEIDFEEHLTNEEATKVVGGILPGGCVTTLAIGEEGGFSLPPFELPEPPDIPELPNIPVPQVPSLPDFGM